MALAPRSAIISVCPSGRDCAVNCPAMDPPAPERFSTTMGWPLECGPKALATARESVSTAPPAPKGTTRRTGPDGHAAACACASPGRAVAAAMAAKARRLKWMVMAFVLPWI